MDTLEERAEPGESHSGSVPRDWGNATFAVTILLSAFLLFQVQPLISKFILPWFGGSPAVWTTCMLFFQTVLFAGYAYAHLNESWLSSRAQVAVHLMLLLGAVALLPIVPNVAWQPVDSENPTWRILCLLAVTVGAPYFVLSSTGPLVQAWFSRSYPGRSPYRLYSLSNIGSMAALLSYPFLVEPAFDVKTQATLWSVAFCVFALLCGYGVLKNWRVGRRDAAAPVHPADNGVPARPPSFADAVLWVVLPAFASLMLLATTNHVCQDVAVIPFLWIVPLTLYLLSFIISFHHERWYQRAVYGVATAVFTFVVATLGRLPEVNVSALHLKFDPNLDVTFLQEISLDFAALFLICMLCHGELVRLRPAPRHLTLYYLLISFGGALGGIFVSLIAPVIFNTFLEWKIGLAVGFWLASALLALQIALWLKPRRPVLAATTAGTVAAVCLAGLVALVVFQTGNRREHLLDTRNFYGEISVLEYAADEDEPDRRTLFSGNIIHGVQVLAPEKHMVPTTYYGTQSGVGLVLEHLQRQKKLRVGVVGLGAGTLAAYGRAGDTYRFYEINPEMLRVAQTYFSFLKDCPATVETALGDARISLQREESQQFDVIVVDAFSGDSIPVHLLTREAFALYLRHLAPNGVICLHITNTYLDLATVARALSKEFAIPERLISNGHDNKLQWYTAHWMLLSRDADFLLALAPDGKLEDVEHERVILWTDAYSNLFQILK